MKQHNPILFILMAVLMAAVVTACGAAEQPAPAAEAEEPAAEEQAASANVDALKQEAVETYAEIVYAGYEDSYELAAEMQEKLIAFVENPSEDTHQAAKDAWLAAREPYGQTEVFRFYGGPIDDEDGPEGLLNAWPLDEAYVDYVEGAPDSGIINDPEQFPTVDAELLVSLNEVGAEENISAGYHAVEFLLWGQDLSSDGSGNRPYTDFVAGGTAENQERRSQFLLAAGEQLLANLDEMKQAWAPGDDGNYRAEFVAQNPDDALQKMFTGMGVLSKSELAGERIFTAYDNQDQEDEHSCFSDNTHRDIITNAQGIKNVYLGEYKRVDGSTVSGISVADVVAEVNPELSKQMLNLVDTSMTQVEAIPVPFDQAIVVAGQRPAVLEAVNALQDQGDKLAEVAKGLGITINTALPE